MGFFLYYFLTKPSIGLFSSSSKLNLWIGLLWFSLEKAAWVKGGTLINSLNNCFKTGIILIKKNPGFWMYFSSSFFFFLLFFERFYVTGTHTFKAHRIVLGNQTNHKFRISIYYLFNGKRYHFEFCLKFISVLPK